MEGTSVESGKCCSEFCCELAVIRSPGECFRHKHVSSPLRLKCFSRNSRSQSRNQFRGNDDSLEVPAAMSHARAHIASLSIVDAALASANILIESKGIVEDQTGMGLPELGAVLTDLVREQPARKGRVYVFLSYRLQ